MQVVLKTIFVIPAGQQQKLSTWYLGMAMGQSGGEE